MQRQKIGRNDPCHCGSGKKFKQCCMGLSNKTIPTLVLPQTLSAAWRYYELAEFSRSEQLCHQVLNHIPGQADALHLLGVLALQDGNIELAIDYLRKANQRQKSGNPQFLSNLGLAYHERGQLELAEDCYKKSIQLDALYLNAYYNLHAIYLDKKQYDLASDCLERILRISPEDIDAKFNHALIADYQGKDSAKEYFKALPSSLKLYQARLDAWRYINSSADVKIPLLGSNLGTFKLAESLTNPEGLVLEFGVRHGNTIRQIARLFKQTVHGFDSFEGLPEVWHHEAKGSYTTKGVIPEVPANVTLHAGWFDRSLPKFLQEHHEPVRFLNIDCDIYSSTQTVLNLLHDRIVVGSVIVFDEYIGNEHWREDEYKAFQEAVTQYGWSYEYICFSMFTKQVGVKITKV